MIIIWLVTTKKAQKPHLTFHNFIAHCSLTVDASLKQEKFPFFNKNYKHVPYNIHQVPKRQEIIMKKCLLFLPNLRNLQRMKKFCVYFFHLQLLLFLVILFWSHLLCCVCFKSKGNSVYTVKINLLSSNVKYFRLKYLGYMINNEMDDGYYFAWSFLLLTITVALVVKVGNTPFYLLD